MIVYIHQIQFKDQSDIILENRLDGGEAELYAEQHRSILNSHGLTHFYQALS